MHFIVSPVLEHVRIFMERIEAHERRIDQWSLISEFVMIMAGIGPPNQRKAQFSPPPTGNFIDLWFFLIIR